MTDDLKARLLKPHLPEATVEVGGETVRVRGLSRGEVFLLGKLGTGDVGAFERRMIHLGMVDPAMTEIEVGEWQQACPAAELEPVGNKIRELSGLDQGADKSVVDDVPEQPGPGVRVLPGAEPVDDGGLITRGDE